jgi:hypothetical protein
MSTSPDQVVQTLSWFLAGRAELEHVEQVLEQPAELGPESSELVSELREELNAPGVSRPKLQPLVRETIEAIAHGD